MSNPARGQIEAKIAEMVRRIVDQFQPERIILFGSHARGEGDPDSDEEERRKKGGHQEERKRDRFVF